ncbi:AAA family ATPase [Vibrio variabilis]|uniref:AAA family ATPase n=1 Tax=Vibrio variabilis TaxID=990271 RepID=UPI000DD76510|nr:AAA family ATPase [Vibrio variabilis]
MLPLHKLIAETSLKLTLIRGLPGSGKSTLAKTFNAAHYEADMYFLNADGEYHYDASKIADAHAWCQTQVESALAANQDVVVANTFVRLWEMKAYKALAKRYQAELEIIVCRGCYPNIHGVSDDVIASMQKRWQD